MKHPWIFWSAIAVVEALVLALFGVAVNMATGGFSVWVGLLLLVAVFLQAGVFVLGRYLAAVQLPGSEPGVDASADLLALLDGLEKRSAVRLRERWESLQLPEQVVDDLERLLDQVLPPIDLPPDPVVLVAGDLGSGKSTQAEVLHRKFIVEAKTDLEWQPWPVLIDARRVDAAGLESAVRAEAPSTARIFAVIVDSLDEVDRSAAKQLVEDARQLVHTYPGSRVVLFSRPGFVEFTNPVKIPHLADRQIELIIDTVAQRSLRGDLAFEALGEEVSKPLFAILAARYHGSYTSGSVTPYGLISLMVEDILTRERELPTEDLSRALRELACKTTLSGGRIREAEAGPLDLRLAMVSTRLVVRHDGYLRFASAIIEQYLAGQAMLRREVDVAEQLSSLRKWEPWRSAWIYAVASGGWQASEDLVAELIAAHPGAASWTIHHAVRLFEHTGSGQPTQPVSQLGTC